jgi:aquaporin Z
MMSDQSPTTTARLVSEGVGTFFLSLLVFIAPHAADFAPLAVSAGLIGLIYMCGPISQAHFNPAVTLAFWRDGAISAREAIFFVIVQCVAATVGAITGSFVILPSAISSVAPTTALTMPPMMTLQRTLSIEFLCTLLMILVILNVARHPRATNNQYYGVAIGLTVLACALVARPISGGLFNPALALGLSLAGRVPNSDPSILLAAYVLTPLCAGLLAQAIFGVMRYSRY